jgi:hypothetical protein
MYVDERMLSNEVFNLYSEIYFFSVPQIEESLRLESQKLL